MARRSRQCPPRSASGTVPPRIFGTQSTKGQGDEAPASGLRGFKYRSNRAGPRCWELPSCSGPGRWVRFLTVMALIQAIFGLLLWFRTPSPIAVGRDAKDAMPANITAFADPDAKITGVTAQRLADIAVLVISTGRNLVALRECLQSLNRVSGFDSKSVLVSQDTVNDGGRKIVEREFGLAWIGPTSGSKTQADTASSASAASAPGKSLRFDAPAHSWQAHYHRSLDHAAWHHFYDRRYKSVLVVEEDMVFAPDLLWYFGQLQIVLQRDNTLLCASAWNDNGLAPYVADPTVVMRTDWFSGIAWVAPIEVLRGQILSHWPEKEGMQDWRVWLRTAMQGRQCLFPEVPRVAFSTANCTGAGQCGAEEVFDRSLSLRSVMSSSRAVNLGDVSRLERANYWALMSALWPRYQSIVDAILVKNLEDLEAALEHISLEAREREMILGDYTARRPLLLRFALMEGSGWSVIAKYFGLAKWAPRGVYYGVIRIRWRDFVLFIADNTSPLLASRSSDLGEVQGVRLADLLRRVGDPKESPAAVPPRSVVNQAPQGVSCARYCESMRHICVDADLAAVDRCSLPLTSVFSCQVCRVADTFKAAPGWDWHDNFCGANGPTKDGHMRVPDCSSEDKGMRRMCVCRKQRGQVPIQLQSPGRRASIPRADGFAQVSPERQRAFKAAMLKDSRASQAVDINRFAPDDAIKDAKPKTETKPASLAVLVVALPTRRSEPNNLELLRQTLTSLRAANGFDAERVLVAHDDGLFATAQLVQEEFYLLRVEVLASKDFTGADRAARLYKGALDYAIGQHFGQSRTILIIEEGTVVAPDILWYMAQLEPLLMRDSTLLCASGLNDNGIAPYVADATVVTRTDYFSGVAWLARTAVLRTELLPKWPKSEWEQFIREPKARHGRQCLIPELSRAKPLANPTPMGIGGKLHATYKDFWQSMPLCKKQWVDLGDTSRLTNDRYRGLFLSKWTGEGLMNAKQISSIRPLKDGRLNFGGPWRLVYHNNDPENDQSWKAIAGFFMIWAEVPIRGAYYGVVRLRWHNTVLFIVPSSSVLARGTASEDGPTMRSSYVADPNLFYAMSRPLLLPVNSELIGASSVGVSCTQVCEESGLACRTEDLYFINNCAALTGVFSCRGCEPSEGSEQPAQAIKAGTSMHERCLYNTDTRSRRPSCDAKHEDTLRLCVCRGLGYHVYLPGGGGESIEAGPPGSDASAIARYKAAASTTKRTTRTTTRTTTSVAPLLPPDFADRLTIQPSQLPILIMATGRRGMYLRKCLESLSLLPGYHPDRVLVSQDGQGDESKNIAQLEFGVGWTVNDQGSKNSFQAFGQRTTAHLKYALTYALKMHFPTVRSLLVVEEDVIFAPDFLWYFAQLEPLLHEDASLWCISAWNDNALAPYVADPTALMRTDIFSGVAWLLPADLYRHELLRRWPINQWDKWLRSKPIRADRQCVIPEMPRVHHIGTLGENVGTFVLDNVLRDETMFWDPSKKLSAVDLGDVHRLRKAAYNHMFSAELRGARLIEQLWQLPDPAADADPKAVDSIDPTIDVEKGQNRSYQASSYEGYEAPSWRLHYETLNPETDGSWKSIARFFRFQQFSMPRGTYREVLRMRWGPGVLFLVAQSSPLILEARLEELPMNPLPPHEFSNTKPRVLVPPDSVVVAGRKAGLSCSSICSAEGRECVTADLVFINSCEALERFHFCQKCEANFGSDQPVLVSQAGNEFYGRCLFNSDMHKYPPSCEANHKDTRRLCICRPPVYSAVPIKVAFDDSDPLDRTESEHPEAEKVDGLPSKGHFEANAILPRWPELVKASTSSVLPDSDQGLVTPSPEVQLASLTSSPPSSSSVLGNPTAALWSLKTVTPPANKAVKLEDYGWEGGHQGEALTPHDIAAFADLKGVPNLKVKPSALPIVVLATSTQADNLRALLTSLRKAKGFSPENVLVVQDLPGVGDFSEVHQIATKEFKTAWANHNSHKLGTEARANSHYKFAIEKALSKHFKGARSLIILSEDEVVSPDILIYFAQLEPLLQQDRSLWCISAWNDNGFAPYVADSTALLRTDWFSGVAWMLPTDKFLPRTEFMLNWPKDTPWRDYLRSDAVRKGRECIIPEVSRTRLAVPSSTLRKDYSDFDEQALPIFSNDVRQDVDLGDVQRMVSAAYERLFLNSWPGLEGLALSVEVGSLANLDGAQRGNLYFVVSDDMETWSAVAHYLRIGTKEKRTAVGAYQGVLRLRWRGGILHVVQQGSALLRRAGLTASRIFSAADFESSQRPVLRAPTVAVILSRPGQSCDDACNATSPAGVNESRQRCHAPDLLFLNSCAALRHYGGEQACTDCIANSGQDQPSLVAFDHSTSAPGPGTCLWNANLVEPPRCDARHPLTARVCACRPGLDPPALPTTPTAGARWRYKQAKTTPGPQPIPLVLEPRTRADESLSNHRCGALFGNRLSADCAKEELWCCSAGMWCGNSPTHCSGADTKTSSTDADADCKEALPTRFCGLGWSLRLPELGLSSIA